MIGVICFILLLSGTLYAAFAGTLPAVTETILTSPSECILLMLNLGGPICLFSGLMRVAEASGLVGGLSRLLSRPVRRLMPRTAEDPELADAVTMNLASNFFGLGNAATPYGIRASERMAGGGAGRSLAVFLLLNTCSVQLIPTTVCALRQAYGASDPLSVLPQVWIVQVLSCAFGVAVAALAFRRQK